MSKQQHRYVPNTDFKTNEEHRVEFYGEGHEPTNSISVNFDTPLDSLNLNWREKELPEKLRTKHVHRFHPYLGKYIPQLIEIFLRKYFAKGQTVLDPFVGSGTTLVQANELGINSIGYDISAFNVLLANAKTAQYDVRKAKNEILDILTRVEMSTQEPPSEQFTLWDQPKVEQLDEDNQYLVDWFSKKALTELLIYRNLIESSEYIYKDLLKIILSRSARSARLVRHFDLDFPKEPQREPYWCYKHSRDCKPTDVAFKFLRRYSNDTIKRITEFDAIRTDASVEIYHADSRKANFPKIDGVITSPPYVGLIDYHEQHSYAYHLLGLEDRRVKEIGPASGGSSQKARKLYQENLGEVFRNLAEVMPSGGRQIVVAGDKHNLYPEIAEIAGLEIEGVIKRHVNRRTGRRSNDFYESVFIWRKP